MKKRHTEEHIIKTIKDHEAGAKVDDICRKLSIFSGSVYQWRSKYAGLEVNEAKRLRELETENNNEKRLRNLGAFFLRAMNRGLCCNPIKQVTN